MIRNRIAVTTIAVVMAVLNNPAYANDGYIAANVQVLAGDDIVTAEYSWASGSLSGFGFVDKSINDDFVITDHEVRANVAGPLYVSTEVGYNRYGGAMGKVGVGVSLAKLPLVRDHFVYFNTYAQTTVFGPDADRLVGVSLRTKSLPVADEVSVYFSGFADIKHNAPDVVQPQAWIAFEKLPFEVGGELAFFGRDESLSAVVKLNF